MSALLLSLLLTVAPPPPDVHVIQFDDLDVLTYEVADAYGMVPNIHALRARGANFRVSATVNAVCAPSRHAFFTGMYSHDNGLWCNSHDCDQGARGSVDFVDMDRTVFQAVSATHAEAFLGKFINDSGDTPGAPPDSPRNPTHVFPQFQGERSTWKGTNDPYTYTSYGTQVNDDGVIRQYGKAAADHQTRVLADLAAAWITANRGARPLLLYFSPVAPHSTGDLSGCTYSGVYSDSYCALSMPDLRDATWNASRWQTAAQMPFYPVADPAFNVPSPLSAFSAKPALSSLDQQHATGLWRSRFHSLIALDAAVGQIVAAGGPDAWYVLTSDNGFQHGTHRLGNKQTAFRQSVYVPLVIAGPACDGTSKPCVVPGYRDQLVLNTDVPVTVAELAGAQMPWADGRSLVPILRGDTPEWRTYALVEHRKAVGAGADLLDFPAYDALLVARPGLAPRLYVEWLGTGEGELYDDAPQLVNLFTSSPDVPSLHARLQLLRACAGETCRQAELP